MKFQKWKMLQLCKLKTFENEDAINMLAVYNGRDYISVRNKAILAILIDTGIRNYELCTLENSNIFETYIRIFGKGYKERVVGKSPYLAKILMKYEQTKEGYFCINKGRLCIVFRNNGENMGNFSQFEFSFDS